jgi:hypothetical protein
MSRGPSFLLVPPDVRSPTVNDDVPSRPRPGKNKKEDPDEAPETPTNEPPPLPVQDPPAPSRPEGPYVVARDTR